MATAENHSVHHCLSNSFDESKIVKEVLDLTPIKFGGKLAYVLQNVLSEDECIALIRESEQVGYKPALVHMGNTAVLAKGYRDSYRVMVDDEIFSKKLFSRIANYLPQTFQFCEISNKRKLKELNERLRFLRYDRGDKFNAHYDGQYFRSDGSAETFVTLQVYLNDVGLIGGETTFLRPGPEKERLLEKNRIEVNPKTGSILVFQHDILHEGSEVKEGRKYTIRMDVLYE